jgi:aminocarboxymuconate-semialdehyde decarboxylase
MARVIDVHNHYYPDEYLQAVDEMEGPISVGEDEEGRNVLLSEGSRIVTLTPPMTDLEARLDDMAAAGVDHQIISLTAPNVTFLPDRKAAELARICNDAYAEIDDEYDEFSMLASIPLNDPDAALKEARRAIEDLGLHGFVIGSNIEGTTLNHGDFEPFYELVDELDVPLFIHPMTPAGNDVMNEYRLAPLVGFENEITMAITRLIFDGVLERHDIDVHLSHLGGTVPYLVERLNNGYRAYPECRERIDKPPGEYLEDVYYDTVSFHEPALRCAIESFGAEQLLLGSDYPHVIGDIGRAVSDIDELELTARERSRIKSGTVEELYGI